MLCTGYGVPRILITSCGKGIQLPRCTKRPLKQRALQILISFIISGSEGSRLVTLIIRILFLPSHKAHRFRNFEGIEDALTGHRRRGPVCGAQFIQPCQMFTAGKPFIIASPSLRNGKLASFRRGISWYTVKNTLAASTNSPPMLPGAKRDVD